MYKAHAGEQIFYDSCHPTPTMGPMIGAAVADFLRDDVKQGRSAHE
jgi:phospholipase/lecithinase/hemolysin